MKYLLDTHVWICWNMQPGESWSVFPRLFFKGLPGFNADDEAPKSCGASRSNGTREQGSSVNAASPFRATDFRIFFVFPS